MHRYLNLKKIELFLSSRGVAAILTNEFRVALSAAFAGSSIAVAIALSRDVLWAKSSSVSRIFASQGVSTRVQWIPVGFGLALLTMWVTYKSALRLRSWFFGLDCLTFPIWFAAGAIAVVQALYPAEEQIAVTFLCASLFTVVEIGVHLYRSDAEEQLDRTDILLRDASLKTLVDHVNAGEPVIAITGDFGDGKSQVLNYLAKRLRGRTDVRVIRFSSWLPGNQSSLVAGLFDSIRKELATQFSIGKLSNAYAYFAKILVGTIPKVGAELSQSFLQVSQEEQIEKLSAFLQKLPFRLVILIDEVDRMQQDELLTLFKLIRGISFHGRVTYVCAFQKDAVARTLSVRFEQTPYYLRYIEKFFPLQVELSKIDASILSAQFDIRLRGLCIKHKIALSTQSDFENSLQELWVGFGRRILSNLRRLDIYFASLGAQFTSSANELFIFDALTLELLRQIAPEVYEFVYRYGYYFYEAKWSWETFQEVPYEDTLIRDREKEMYEALIQSIEIDRRFLVVGLLEQLFPRFATYRGLRRQISKEDKRIYNPSYFPRYFIHRAPQTQFGDREFEVFKRTLESAPSKGESVVRAELRSINDNARRQFFLDSLSVRFSEFSAASQESIVRGLALTSDSFATGDLLGDLAKTRALVFQAAQDSATPEQLLQWVIKNAASDEFATSLFFYLSNRDRNKIFTKWSLLDMAAIKQTVSERLQGTIAKTNLDDHQDNLLGILFRWEEADDEEARKYVRRQIQTSPVAILKLLEWSSPGGITSDFQALSKKLLSAEEIERAVQAAEAGTIPQNFQDVLSAYRAIVPPKKEIKATKLFDSHDIKVRFTQLNEGWSILNVRNDSPYSIEIQKISFSANGIAVFNQARPLKNQRWFANPANETSVEWATGAVFSSLFNANSQKTGVVYLDLTFTLIADGEVKNFDKRLPIRIEPNGAVFPL